jgi:hypothetical protein
MEIVKVDTSQIYQGELTFYIPPGKRFKIESFTPVQITGMTDDGEMLSPVSRGTILQGKSPGIISLVPEDPNAFWTVDYAQANPDPADPDPVEVAIPEPLTLRERIQETIREMMANEFGTQSQEMETWEEAQDFLMDDTDDIITPYEAIEMIPEEVLPQGEAPAEPEAPASSPGAETSPEAPTDHVETSEPPPATT